jgi:hypothetical protein
MTQRYTHLRDETLKRASDLAGDIIEGAAKDKSQKKRSKNSIERIRHGNTLISEDRRFKDQN